MFNKILFPTDSSECSERALEYVAEIATKHESEVVLLHSYVLSLDAVHRSMVYATMDDYLEMVEKNLAKFGDEALKKAEKALEEKGVKVCKKIILKEKPGPAIANAVTTENCDVIVMGSRGLGVVKSVLLGSVSNYVAHHVDCPVLLVR